MKKKGFTLVELLAVIAILAILVIVAMPNVLGMFNQSKANTFITEVQEYMNVATTSFMQNALSIQGKTLYFGNGTLTQTGTGDAIKLGTLDMSGTEKKYFIEMDRNGNFQRVVIFDDNYCYDSKKHASDKQTDFEKTDILVNHAVEVSGTDSVAVAYDKGTKVATVTGCQGTTPALAE